MFGQLLTYVTPDTFHTALLIQFLVVVFVGGVTRLSGAVVGAVFVIVSRELLQDVGEWQRFVYGISLVLAVRFLPGGLTSLPARLTGIRRRRHPRTRRSRRHRRERAKRANQRHGSARSLVHHAVGPLGRRTRPWCTNE